MILHEDTIKFPQRVNLISVFAFAQPHFWTKVGLGTMPTQAQNGLLSKIIR